MTSRPTIGSLCTGYGGLDIAVAAHYGAGVRWYAEFDKHAAAVAGRHHPGAPNLGDITKISWTEIPPVDIITAGYPCQPFSTAGKRKGTNDDRHIWPYIANGIRVLQPRIAILENVAGHITLGFAEVLADLAAMGRNAKWGIVRASDAGACHQRKRLFVISTIADPGS